LAENRGIAPPDMSSNVGKFRALAGDVEFTEYDPPQPGFGMYQKFSDSEIEGFLAAADDSLEGALYFSFMQLAGDAAMEAKQVKDFDLMVNTEKRATELRLIAQMWKDRWDASTEDIFEVFDIGRGCDCVPELAPRPVCRRGCSGSRLF
jgi:hypothetical protein